MFLTLPVPTYRHTLLIPALVLSPMYSCMGLDQKSTDRQKAVYPPLSSLTFTGTVELLQLPLEDYRHCPVYVLTNVDCKSYDSTRKSYRRGLPQSSKPSQEGAYWKGAIENVSPNQTVIGSKFTFFVHHQWNWHIHIHLI